MKTTLPHEWKRKENEQRAGSRSDWKNIFCVELDRFGSSQFAWWNREVLEIGPNGNRFKIEAGFWTTWCEKTSNSHYLRFDSHALREGQGSSKTSPRQEKPGRIPWHGGVEAWKGAVDEKITSDCSRLCKDSSSINFLIFSTISKLAKECDGDAINSTPNPELKYLYTVRKVQGFSVVEIGHLSVQPYRHFSHTHWLQQESYVLYMPWRLAPILKAEPKTWASESRAVSSTHSRNMQRCTWGIFTGLYYSFYKLSFYWFPKLAQGLKIFSPENRCSDNLCFLSGDTVDNPLRDSSSLSSYFKCLQKLFSWLVRIDKSDFDKVLLKTMSDKHNIHGPILGIQAMLRLEEANGASRRTLIYWYWVGSWKILKSVVCAGNKILMSQ